MRDGRPFKGLRILDLTRVLAGPFCTMILADLGADVIKVEKPVTGDDSRQFPPFIKDESAYYLNLNRNKRSITLNLKNPKGEQVLESLVQCVDVLIENFKPGTMEKLGLGYEKLKKLNPRLIYAAISGFGHDSAYRNRPCYDIIGQAVGGIMGVTGWPESPPTRTGTAIADVLAGLFCCIGILGALRSRELTGRGQKIDVAMVDSVIAALENLLVVYTVEGRIPQRIGNRYEFIYPYDSFRTKDDWIVIGVANDEIWNRFCKVMGRPELYSDERFASNKNRIANHNLLKEIVQSWTATRRSDEIVEKLNRRDIPCARVNSVESIVKDPKISRARQMVVEVEHPGIGVLRLTGCPIKMSASKLQRFRPAPGLGADTADVLREVLSMNIEKISQLKQAGAL